MQPAEAWECWLSRRLGELSVSRQLRSLRPVLPGSSPVEVLVPAATLAAWLADTPSTGLDGATSAASSASPPVAPPSRVLLFSSNDYLGLSSHPAVRRACAEAAAAHGSGPRASALVAGYTASHRDLETALARLKGADECLLFPTGFAANVSCVAALAGDGRGAVVSDTLNHASLVDGARLAARAGAAVSVYRHADADHAAQLVEAAAAAGRRPLLTSDSLFSMDGDWAPEAALLAAAFAHGGMVLMDDAHATLVGRGPGGDGAGAACAEPLPAHVLRVGTLSKAVGAQGGFVCCSRGMKQLLVSAARGQVYSTALPLPTVAAAAAALRVAAAEPELGRALWRNVATLGAATGLPCASPIVSLRCGSEADALAASQALLRAGFHVPAIRPPTVPQGTSRLRVALSAAHSTHQVDALATALRDLGVVTGGGARSRL